MAIVPNQCAVGDAVSRGRLWTPDVDELYGPTKKSHKHYCNKNAAAAPGIFRSTIRRNIQIQEIDFDDLRDTLRNAIESARAINPNVDTGIYFRGRIQTLVSDDNTLYVYESYALGNPELFQEHLNGTLRAGATVVELDPLDGFAYQPPAAPPKLKPSKTSLATTWASVKQK